MEDVTARWGAKLGVLLYGNCADDIEAWAKAHDLEQIVTAWAPVGPNADTIRQITNLPVVPVRRPYDTNAWPHATHGFFKFKEKIPALISGMQVDASTR